MAKIIKLSKPSKFNELQRASEAMNEHNDCAVKAVALYCEVSYQQAHAVLKSLGRKDRCGTLDIVIRKAIRRITGNSLFLAHHMDWVSEYPAPHHNLKSMTTYHPVRFKKVFEKKTGKYLIFVRGHVLVMIDGEVIDWTNDKAMRVESVWSSAW